MALERFIYPIDFTAKIATNRAINEPHNIGVGKYRTVVPNKGAFYADTIIVKELSNSTPLVRGTDYECLYTYNDLIRQASGKEVVGAIVIHNESVGTDIEITYQFVGGPFSSSATFIQQAIDALNLDDRDVLFENIINVPDYFIPAPHVHDIGDVFGFEYIINMLASLREAVLIGDNAVNNAIKDSIEALEALLTSQINQHLADFSNPHKVTAHQTGTYDAGEIDNELSRIAGEYALLAPQFADLIAQIQVINNEIGAVNGVLSSQSIQLNNYQQGLTALDLTVTAFNQRVAQAESDIDTLEDQNLARINDISGINDAITAINGTASAHNLRLNSLEGSIPGINASINANANAITALGNRATSLEGRMDTVESNIDNIDDLLGDYVEHSDVTDSNDTTGNDINNRILKNINHVVRMPRYVRYHYNDAHTERLSWEVTYNSGLTAYQHYCSARISVLDVYIRSDIRDKKNISDVQPAKADQIIAKVGSGIRYMLKGSRKYVAGLNAQKVQKHFKEAVTEVMDNEVGEKRLTISPPALIGLLFSGYMFIREKVLGHDKRIKKLERTIELQGKELKALKDKLSKG